MVIKWLWTLQSKAPDEATLHCPFQLPLGNIGQSTHLMVFHSCFTHSRDELLAVSFTRAM